MLILLSVKEVEKYQVGFVCRSCPTSKFLSRGYTEIVAFFQAIDADYPSIESLPIQEKVSITFSVHLVHTYWRVCVSACLQLAVFRYHERLLVYTPLPYFAPGLHYSSS